MAEDVIIQGFGNGDKMPDFATEATQKDLLSVMKAAGLKGLKTQDLEKLISAISKGDTDIAALLKAIKDDSSSGDKKLIDHLKSANEKLTKIRETNAKSDKTAKRESDETQKILSEFSSMMGSIRDGLNSGELGLGDSIAGVAAAMQVLSGPVAAAGAAIAGLATAVHGANSFMLELGQDRFDAANEIRQRGLATSLDVSTSSLEGFSTMVNDASFTLGQAAEFTRQFSRTIGDMGIERALYFVEEMAYGGAEGANMMQRFGMEFGQVRNVAGEYLETIRNIGMLDRMNNQQLRSGMEDFMETVTVTSNVLKVSLEDAATMIAQTLNQRDDLTAMLATLPENMRSQVTDVVGAMGASGTVVEEALATFLASGNMANFRTTEVGQELAGSIFGQRLLPIIEQMGTSIQAGGDLGQIIANSTSSLEAVLQSAQGAGEGALIRQSDDQLGIRLIAQLSRTLGTREDAALGNQADTTVEGRESDRAFVDRMMVGQRQVLAQEDMLNRIVQAADFATTLTQRNADNLAMINTIQEGAAGLISTLGDDIAGITFGAESAMTRFANSLGEGANAILGFVSEEMAQAQAIVREQNRQAMEMLGLDPESVARQAAEETARIIQETEEIQRESETGDGLVRINLDETDIERRAREYRKDINQYTLDDGSTEYRIGAGPGAYTVVPEELARRLLGERNVAQQMMGEVDNYDGVDRGFASSLISSMFGSDDGRINASDLAEILGVNNRDQLEGFNEDTGRFEDSRFEFMEEMIRRLDSQNAISPQQLEQLNAALAQITTSGWFTRESTEIRESGERDRLITAIESLVTELRQ